MDNFLRSKEMWSLVENEVPEQTMANLTKPQRKAFEEAKLKDLKGSTKVKRAQLQALRREYELLSMKEDCPDFLLDHANMTGISKHMTGNPCSLLSWGQTVAGKSSSLGMVRFAKY
ncbi:hypothetical protein Tco_0218922 [Tanacetum coccineum]